jgi:hypothetical protein
MRSFILHGRTQHELPEAGQPMEKRIQGIPGNTGNAVEERPFRAASAIPNDQGLQPPWSELYRLAAAAR